MKHARPRPNTSPTLKLQPRDLELLRMLLRDFGLLTRRQIGELFPERGLRRTNFRLHHLVQAGYLSRRLPTGPMLQRIPLYYLGPSAAEALGLESSDPTVAVRRKQAAHLRDRALQHFMLTNSAQLRFLTAGRDYPDYELLSWIPHYDPLWNRLDRFDFRFRPDGYGEFRKDGSDFRVFIELDNATERGAALHKKLAAYHDYVTSGRYKDHFRADGFRVLFIPPTQRRANHLLRAMRLYLADLFWVASFDQFFRQPLFHPHWQSTVSDHVSLNTPL